MPDNLNAETLALRRQLEELLAQARLNEEIMRRHQQIDLAFIGASGFRELVECAFDAFTESSELDVVTLALLDPDYAMRRMLLDLDVALPDYPKLLFLDQPAGFGGLPGSLQKPLLGTWSEQDFGTLFPKLMARPRSVAILPLLRNGELIGSLNLGSFRPRRYTAGMATDFLEHRASVLALCLENVTNRELLKRMGLTDGLTGVNNRRYIERRLVEEVGRACRQGLALSCMYIDIDHFKQVNDQIGHQAGDDVLREVAARIKIELRLSDALGRFGGEEFLVLLTGTDQPGASTVAERMRKSIARPLRIGSGEELHVTASIGIACMSRPDPTREHEKLGKELVAAADRALYVAKQAGRNRVVAVRF
jgi:two-component system cell cycle response regulator